MPPADAPSLYLIDGHAHFFRAYHAISSGMTSPVTKEPTNLTFGFMGMLLKLLRDRKPDYLAVAIDVGGDKETFRSEIYPEYKANRPETPQDFHPQVQRCLELLEKMGIPVIGVPGVEADDVIATLVRQLEARDDGLTIRIASRDKDLAQLISQRVQLLDVYKDETISPAAIFRTDGVAPRHVRDILALMGDPTDNVPGVPGIGPKTAAALITRFGSLDELMDRLDELKGKRREILEASRDLVKLSRRLVTLKDDVAVTLDLEKARCEPEAIPLEPLLAVFRELGFHRLQSDLIKLAGGTAKADPPPEGAVLFPDAVREPPAEMRGEYRMVSTAQELDRFIEEIRAAGEMSVDTETDSLSPRRARLCGVSVSLQARRGCYIPTRSPEPARHLDTETVLRELRPVLEDPSIAKIGQNLKFDLNVLRSHGVRLAGISFDTMVASYLIDPTRSSHKLDDLALAHLQYPCIPITDLIGTGRTHKKTFDQVPLDLATRYAAEDADIALRLRDVLAPQLKTLGLDDLFHKVEMPLVEVLAELEFNGIRVDPVELDRQRFSLGEQIEQLRASITEAAPHPFNPDSPKQLAVVLFNRPDQDPPGLGLRVRKRGKTGPSTDQEVLQQLSTDPALEPEVAQVPRLIVQYRQLTKLVNTYLVALKEAINPSTGRVHASFNQTVAATGRLSSSDPNLQNIPIRTDVGRRIRRAFVADPGPPEHVLITADYSQIELRLLAHLSEDEALTRAFCQGVDIHTAVAVDVFGVPSDQVTPAQRDTAKMVNFGIIYGITPYGLARRLGAGTSVDEAARYIAEYKARFPRIDEFLNRCVTKARDDGYVETILKRRRPIDQIHARQSQLRALGERMAINTVVQGSAADLIKLAMIDLYQKLPLRFPAARMLLQIHDELVFEAPRDQADAVQRFVAQRMESAMKLRVPLLVETAFSRSWIDAK